VLKDDLTLLLDSLKETDMVILDSFVYFFDTIPKIKAMLERWYS
jgi:multimeric flavodoxin WrbA